MHLVNYFAEFFRLFIFIILITAVIGKVTSVHEFCGSIAELFGVRTNRLTDLTAFIIIGLEGCTAILLILGGAFAYFGMMLAMSLFAVFTIFVAVIVKQRRIVNCNCFGVRTQNISWLDLLRNIILLASCCFYLGYASANDSLSIVESLILLGLAVSMFYFTTGLKDIKYLLQ